MSVKFVWSLLYVLSSMYKTECYVLVQVPNENNQPHQALLQTVMKPEENEDGAKNTRNLFIDYAKYRASQDEEDDELESIVFDFNIEQADYESLKSDPFTQNIVKFMKKILNNASLKTNKELGKYIRPKPQNVNFGNGKTSMFRGINLEKMIDAVKDIIGMKFLRSYFSLFANV